MSSFSVKYLLTFSSLLKCLQLDTSSNGLFVQLSLQTVPRLYNTWNFFICWLFSISDVPEPGTLYLSCISQLFDSVSDCLTVAAFFFNLEASCLRAETDAHYSTCFVCLNSHEERSHSLHPHHANKMYMYVSPLIGYHLWFIVFCSID